MISLTRAPALYGTAWRDGDLVEVSVYRSNTLGAHPVVKFRCRSDQSGRLIVGDLLMKGWEVRVEKLDNPALQPWGQWAEELLLEDNEWAAA